MPAISQTLEFRLNPTGSDPLAHVKSADTDGAGAPVETRSVARSRARAIRFAVPSGGRRSEIEPGIRELRDGDDLYFGYRGYLPRDFPVRASSWQVIEQWQSSTDEDRSPAVAIEITGGRFVLTGGRGGPDPFRVSIGRALAGRVVDLVTHIRFAHDRARSRIDVWLDGRRAISDFHPAGGILPDPASTAFLRTGLSRDAAIRQDAELLLDDLRVSRTLRGAGG